MGEVLSCLPFLRAASFRCVMVTFDTPMMCLIARANHAVISLWSSTHTYPALPAGFSIAQILIADASIQIDGDNVAYDALSQFSLCERVRLWRETSISTLRTKLESIPN